MTTQCCNCHRVKSPKGWKNPRDNEFAPDTVSHTYCPACYSEFRVELAEWQKNNARTQMSS